jgi:hypothetical protein
LHLYRPFILVIAGRIFASENSQSSNGICNKI